MRVNLHLIEKLKQKDEEAFEIIYNEYSNLIYYIALSLGRLGIYLFKKTTKKKTS